MMTLKKWGLVVVLCGSLNLSQAQIVSYPLSDSTDAPTPPAQLPEPEADNGLGQGVPMPPESGRINADLEPKKLSTCSIKYKMRGFSLAYKQYDGTGWIKCRNGQQAEVALSSKSIGFTIGKSEIEGEGHFSDVTDINEIYGNYLSLENHFGFLKSVDQQVLTRGEISLYLLGKGRGIDIGFTIGDLNIEKR